jgi:lipid-binding SYLF domain-containing protein
MRMSAFTRFHTPLITRICYVLVAVLLIITAATFIAAQDSVKLDKKVTAATKKLMASSPAAVQLAKTAKGILIFPEVKKAGFLIGGQYGEGALRVGGKTTGYFKTTAASFGLQAGGQKFGYAMFLMNDKAMESMKDAKGWEVGVGPTLVVVDEGKSGSLTNANAKEDIYVFFFGQKGLMAGLEISGSKITKFDPND